MLQCIFECIGKKKNVVSGFYESFLLELFANILYHLYSFLPSCNVQLTVNGSINTEEMKKYLSTELFQEDWQKELAEKIVPKCLNEKYGKYHHCSFRFLKNLKTFSVVTSEAGEFAANILYSRRCLQLITFTLHDNALRRFPLAIDLLQRGLVASLLFLKWPLSVPTYIGLLPRAMSFYLQQIFSSYRWQNFRGKFLVGEFSTAANCLYFSRCVFLRASSLHIWG